MAETYCGKNCADCTQKGKLNCPGCSVDSETQFGFECELAQCCSAKGQENCQGCKSSGSCGKFKGRENVPDKRHSWITTEKAKKESLAWQALILGHWLWILFWLIIPSTVASIMTYDAVVQLLPVLYTPGLILDAACTVAYGYILIKLAIEHNQYRTAGICTLIAGGINLIFSGSSSISSHLVLILSVLTSFIGFVGEYNEMTAHDTVLIETDFVLSEKWTKLRKWYVVVFLVYMGSLLLLMLIPVVGAVVALVSSVGMLIISVLKLICMYRTARVFREYKG